MRFAFWISKATDTHSEYVILIACPWQKYFENAPQRYVSMYNACLVNTIYVTIETIASTSVVTSVSIPLRKLVDGMLKLFMVKKLKKQQNIMSTGTIYISCVVERSHVFQNLLRQERRHMHV